MKYPKSCFVYLPPCVQLQQDLYQLKSVVEMLDDKIGIHFSEEYFLAVIRNVLDQMTCKEDMVEPQSA